MNVLACVDAASKQCEVRRVVDKAPHAPVAGTSTMAMFNEKLRVDLSSLDDIIAVHVMSVFP